MGTERKTKRRDLRALESSKVRSSEVRAELAKEKGKKERGKREDPPLEVKWQKSAKEKEMFTHVKTFNISWQVSRESRWVWWRGGYVWEHWSRGLWFSQVIACLDGLGFVLSISFFWVETCGLSCCGKYASHTQKETPPFLDGLKQNRKSMLKEGRKNNTGTLKGISMLLNVAH